jgi:mono/diheme cytochrome c family protein
MKALLIVLIWVGLSIAILAAAFYLTRPKAGEPRFRGHFPGGVRILIGLAALFFVVGVPAIVLAASDDRLPSGAGTYTIGSSPADRQGRIIFRETCASCHTLSAANARGVYGPNLDDLLAPGVADPKSTSARVQGAIKLGGSTGKLMPVNLLEGNDAKLVSDYIAKVASK